MLEEGKAIQVIGESFFVLDHGDIFYLNWQLVFSDGLWKNQGKVRHHKFFKVLVLDSGSVDQDLMAHLIVIMVADVLESIKSDDVS